jgi:hypothetical protein
MLIARKLIARNRVTEVDDQHVAVAFAPDGKHRADLVPDTAVVDRRVAGIGEAGGEHWVPRIAGVVTHEMPPADGVMAIMCMAMNR